MGLYKRETLVHRPAFPPAPPPAAPRTGAQEAAARFRPRPHTPLIERRVGSIDGGRADAIMALTAGAALAGTVLATAMGWI